MEEKFLNSEEIKRSSFTRRTGRSSAFHEKENLKEAWEDLQTRGNYSHRVKSNNEAIENFIEKATTFSIDAQKVVVAPSEYATVITVERGDLGYSDAQAFDHSAAYIVGLDDCILIFNNRNINIATISIFSIISVISGSGHLYIRYIRNNEIFEVYLSNAKQQENLLESLLTSELLTEESIEIDSYRD